jgi:hypothetical protein
VPDEPVVGLDAEGLEPRRQGIPIHPAIRPAT